MVWGFARGKIPVVDTIWVGINISLVLYYLVAIRYFYSHGYHDFHLKIFCFYNVGLACGVYFFVSAMNGTEQSVLGIYCDCAGLERYQRR